ncbi:hypothetical protein Pan241w_45510 [Gimesia alba]|uniref:Uncharacterized protein n=1 Tax=Gimesia alba TaxID=2527973 RepID=A0A517RKU6_9PLAN|nr:hypothetical protein [Gimesia alba]QDT44442.1 hypothetical protein Pan241w_45510 [Gimesia alba]
MLHSKTILWLLIAAFSIFSFSVSEGNQAAKPKQEMMTFRAIQTVTGPEIEIKVGDLVCSAPYFTFKHKQQPDWSVTPVKGKVQIRRGTTVSTAQQVSIAIRR